MKNETLTNKELQIMDILWNLPAQKGTVNDILDQMPEPKPAYTTVGTFLNILCRKGFVKSKRKSGTQMFLFEPRISRREYTVREVSHLKDKLFGGSRASLVSFFVESEETTESDIAELVELVNNLK